MPLGFERLNERSQRPNACINFIKPLTSTSPEDQAIAKNFLERIAAQCYPVMKKEYLSVMALEEYPPNPEFLGRNFNAGEVIQLVLKDKAGRWLSFRFVQMVMMHELAHCKQMNHSRYFWAERNRFAAQMEELWAKGYKGEGLWGCGQELTSGVVVPDRMPEGVDIPEHLCGGTYHRGRGRKRKRGQDGPERPKVTYAERQQKRIAKKFGIHGEGQALEEDELVRGALEQGKRHYGKPRVANSKRGRELRANAALARFEAAKQKAAEKTPELVDDDDSETDSADDDEDPLGNLEMAVNGTGAKKITDEQGRDLYQVCGDEGDQDDGGQDELADLRRLGEQPKKAARPTPPKASGDDSETESEPDEPVPSRRPADSVPGQTAKQAAADSETESESVLGPAVTRPSSRTPEVLMDIPSTADGPTSNTLSEGNTTQHRPHPPVPTWSLPSAAETGTIATTCPICSLENEPRSPTCMACSHVLKPSLMRNHWRCKSEQCKGSKYINAGDVGRCGICGAQRPADNVKPVGVIGGDVLRWE